MKGETGLQKIYLFLDVRHIRCGDLEWRSPTCLPTGKTGEKLPLVAPPPPPVEAIAARGIVPHGIRLVAQKATKTEPLPAGTPRGARVIHDGGVYRSWFLQPEYPPCQNLGSYSKARALSVSIACSESADGFDWKEKARSQITTPGWTGFDGFTVFIDPNGPASERYKAVFMGHPREEDIPRLAEEYRAIHPRYQDWRILPPRKLRCMYAAVSPDGLQWQGLPEHVMIHFSDTDTTVYYDEWLERYVMYTRLYPYERRAVGRAETQDFRRWRGVQPLIWAGLDGSLSDDVYTNARCTYPDLPQYHLMFPATYHRFTQDGDVFLHSSADGISWNKVPGGPVIPHGEVGEWDSAWLTAVKDLVPFGADRVAISYAATCYPHKYPRWAHVLEAHRGAWAWWQKGRLCAVTADEEGEFSTFPILPAGRELRLNYRTKRAGEIRVGIVPIEGRSANDCDPLFGDSLSAPVHWRGETDVRAAEGKPVTLHFRLRAAELFGFEWA